MDCSVNHHRLGARAKESQVVSVDISRIGLVSYMTPPMKDGGFRPPATLDPTVASPAEIESESRFQEMMTSKFTSDFRQAATAFHEPLPAAVAALRPDPPDVRKVAAFALHTSNRWQL
jgi:hypothetical protein